MDRDQQATLAWQLHNIEAEQSLLGCILLNNDAHGFAAKFVETEHFFEPIHREIYQICSDLIVGGRRADPIIVKTFLPPNYEIAQGLTIQKYLARLAASALPIISAPDYAKTIRELADRRKLAEVAYGLMPADASHPVGLAVEAISALDTIVAASTDTGAPSLNMKQAMERAVLASAEAYQNDGQVVGIPTTFRDLDTKTGGMSRGDLVVLAGRPGMGKSAKVLTMLRRQAERGYRSMLVSLEMSDIPMSHRMISDVIFDYPCENLPYMFLRNGRFHAKMFDHIRDAADRLAELPIRIEQQPGLTVGQIATRARQMKRKGGLDILAIDHLDLIKPSGRYAGNKVYELGEITAALKALAKELDIVVVLLCQLSRALESREDKRPLLSDLRSSGSIEQDADTVIFLFRKAYYLASSEPDIGTEEHMAWQRESELAHNKLLVIVGKQRMGPTGSIEMFCDIGCNAVRDLTHEYPGAGQ